MRASHAFACFRRSSSSLAASRSSCTNPDRLCNDPTSFVALRAPMSALSAKTSEKYPRNSALAVVTDDDRDPDWPPIDDASAVEADLSVSAALYE